MLTIENYDIRIGSLVNRLGDTKLTIESYLKNYDRYPLMLSDPMLLVLDESSSMSRSGF